MGWNSSCNNNENPGHPLTIEMSARAAFGHAIGFKTVEGNWGRRR